MIVFEILVAGILFWFLTFIIPALLILGLVWFIANLITGDKK